MATITCAIFKGDFPLNITWTLNGVTVNNINGISIIRTNKRISQLSIEDVQDIHAGVYVCNATNFAGTNTHSTHLQVNGTACTLLNPNYLLFIVPPQIVPFDFGEDPINSGDVTSVLCTANKGDLPLNITWTLNGHSINKFKGVSVFQNNKRSSQLSIDFVQAEHSGTFTCTISNPAGFISHESVLRVNGTFL